MLNKIKTLILGSPLPTRSLTEKRLNKVRALAAFSPDALSSIAYANQEIFLGLVVAGASGLSLAMPIGIAIVLLLTIVAASYFQTIEAYPGGGGSYVVARDNLGSFFGLIAAAALLMDYVLTAAVSLTAGVEAIASAYPILWSLRTEIALFLLVIITLANMRGLKETGTLMSIPVYLFLFTFIPMIVFGLFKLSTQGVQELGAVAPPAVKPVTLFLILHTFATGCTALTGIEAISNGIPSFQPPEIKNARITLVVMAILMGFLFAGSIGLTQSLGIIAGPQQTILAALSQRLLGDGPGFYLIQFATMAVLAVAANTSFAGFPRLAAILAQDRYLPRQLTSLGDRLVFANGIGLLALASGFLIVLFRGESHALIPLFAVGVFIAFTLSQLGMVVHWLRLRTPHWQVKASLNGLGALTTAITMIVIGYSKMLEGAWITFFLICVLVIVFMRIKHHYQDVSSQLTLRGLPPSLRPLPSPRIVIPVSGVHRGIIDAIDFSSSISKDVTGLYIELNPGEAEKVKAEWERWFPNIPLVVRASPFRSVVAPLLEFLDETDFEHNDGQMAVVVLPEFIPARWWHGLLHNQTTWLIKTALLYRRRHLGFQRVIIDIPYHLRR
ncbi:MAG: APC family permease [Anaerolineales bacterium]|nr:APC family permease [Anaerolineales bacterium]